MEVEVSDKSATSKVGLTIGVVGMVIFIILVIVGVAIASSRNNTTSTTTGFQPIGAATNTASVSGGWSGWTIAGVIVGVVVLIVFAGLVIWAFRK